MICVEIITHIAINLGTHRFKAVFTLNSKFFRCTAKSINAMTSSFSAAAVFSIRPLQWLFRMCISAEVHQYVTLTYDS